MPLRSAGGVLGVIAAFDRLGDEAQFEREDEDLLEAFAASAATAVATARSWPRSACAHSMAAAERERRRWARELHDETLQTLAGSRPAPGAPQGLGEDSGRGRPGRERAPAGDRQPPGA